jgi:hypothetical protein
MTSAFIPTSPPYIPPLRGDGDYIPTTRVPLLARGPGDWLLPLSNETAGAIGLGRITSDYIPTTRLPCLNLARGPTDLLMPLRNETAGAPLRPQSMAHRHDAAGARRSKGPGPGSLAAVAAILHYAINRGIPKGPKDDAGAVAELQDYAVQNELPFADELTRNLGKFLEVALEALKLPDKAPGNDAEKAPRGSR